MSLKKALLAATVLSLPIAFARMSDNRVLNGIAYAYVYIFRSTPLLAQLFLIYYGLGSFRRHPGQAGAHALGIQQLLGPAAALFILLLMRVGRVGRVKELERSGETVGVSSHRVPGK